MSPVTAYVLLLIAQLGDDSFSVRQDASAQLASLGTPAHRLLMSAKLTSDDPEVRHRAGGILEDWRSAYRPTKRAITPWLDSLPDDYPDKQAILTRMLKEARGGVDWSGYDYDSEVQDWPIYRTATDLFVDQLIAAGRSKKEIIRLLDLMADREARYWKMRNREDEHLPD